MNYKEQRTGKCFWTGRHGNPVQPVDVSAPSQVIAVCYPSQTGPNSKDPNAASVICDRRKRKTRIRKE